MNSNLITQLRDVLTRSGFFDDDRTLRALFVDDRLAPWRGQLPETHNTAMRVQQVVAWLYRKTHAQTGANALVSLLQVLYDHTDSADSLQRELAQLAEQVQASLSPVEFFNERPSGAWEDEAGEILDGWSIQEMVMFCYDYFPPVYQRLSRSPRRAKVLKQEIIRHCRRAGQGEILVDLLVQYEL
jgi:hypothetical protein